MSAPGFLNRLSHRDRRAIVIGLIVLAPAALWVLAVRPYRNALADANARLTTERELLAREEGLLASADRLPDDLHAAAATAERAERRLVGTSVATVAEADVTDYIESLASSSRVLLTDIRGMQIGRNETPPAGLQIIRLAFTGESDLDGISGLLRRMEEGTTLLRVTEMTMSPVVERRRTSSRGNQSAESRPTGYINFTMVIEAYAPADAAGATASKESGP